MRLVSDLQLEGEVLKAAYNEAARSMDGSSALVNWKLRLELEGTGRLSS